MALVEMRRIQQHAQQSVQSERPSRQQTQGRSDDQRFPGILLSPLVNLSIFFLVKGETQGLNALKRSWETLKKKPILILWTIALGIFAKLGLLVCCVGVFATAPIAMCATYKLFQQAIGEDNKPAPVQTDENAPLPS